jgi:hypothetical protein
MMAGAALRITGGGNMGEQQFERDDVLRMARLAGLDLPGAYEAELVEAHGHVRRLVALLPRPRARSDQPAHVFDPARFGPGTG